jgi:hypothetical protein
VQTGGKKPKAAAPDVQRSLEAAERDAEVLRRAIGMAEQDLADYTAAHRAEIRHAILRTLWQKSLELRQHAQSAAVLFATIEGARQPLKSLAPQPEDEPVLPEGWRGNRVSNTFINVLGGGGDAGLNRGTIEGVLAHLQLIADQFEPYGDSTEGAA